MVYGTPQNCDTWNPWEECGRQPGAHRDIVKKAWEKLNEENALAEEDKTEWEYNLDLNLKIIFLLGMTIMVDWRGKENYLLPFSNSAASFLCPIIGITGSLAIAAPHFMPSGHLWTLKGNTGGHKLIVMSFKQSKLKTDEEKALLWLLDSLHNHIVKRLLKYHFQKHLN